MLHVRAVTTSHTKGGIYSYHRVVTGERVWRIMQVAVSDVICDRTRHRGSLHAAWGPRWGLRPRRGSSTARCWRGRSTKSPAKRTYPTDQAHSPSCDCSIAAGQEVSCPIWNQCLHYLTHKSISFVRVLITEESSQYTARVFFF